MISGLLTLGRRCVSYTRAVYPCLYPAIRLGRCKGCCTCCYHAVQMGRKGENYLLSGTYMTLKELSSLVQGITHHKTPKRIVPTAFARIGLPFISLYARIKAEDPLYTSESLTILKQCNPLISHDKAQKELDFNPRPLKETLIDTFDWQKSEWN